MQLQTEGSSITGNRDTRQHKHNQGRRCHSHDPGGVSRTDRPSVQVRKVKTNTRWRDKLRNQPRLKDHQAYRNSKGSAATASEEDRANATLCLSLKAIGAAVETTSHVADRVLEVRGGDGTSTQPQAQQSSNPGRLQHTARRGIS